MKVRFCTFLLVSLLLAAAPLQQEDEMADEKNIVGKWNPTTFEQGGKKAEKSSDQLKVRLEFTKKSLIFTEPDGDEEKGTWKLNSQKKPKQINIMPEGSSETILAIYELKDDSLKLCFVLGSDKRPKEFKTKEGTRETLVTLKRAK